MLIAVKIASPISFILTIVFVLFSRSKLIIPISAVVTAIIFETVLSSTNPVRNWGSGLILGVIAALIQAGFAYWLVGLFRKK